MNQTLNQISAKTFLVMSLRQPKDAMRLVLHLGLSARAIWIIFAIIVVANTITDSIMLSMLDDYLKLTGLQLVVPTPFSMVFSKSVVLLAVALSLSRFSFDIQDRSQRFYDVLSALLLFRAVATLLMVVGMVLFLGGPTLSSLFLVASQIYVIWLVANYASVALGGVPVGNALMLLVIALLIGLSLLLFIMVIFSLIFGTGI